MVVGRESAECDKTPLPVNGGEICAVEDFTYLGSTIAASGRMDVEVERRVALTSRAFGALRRAVFLDKNLRLVTKRKIYPACILSVLMYGSECWIPLKKHVRKLNSFHHRCIRNILGCEWYEEACRSRPGWRAMCRRGVERRAEAEDTSGPREESAREVKCDICMRSFRRESDKKRHKCSSEKEKPVWEQRGAVECGACRRWFYSRGGPAVHTCRPEP